MGSLFISLFTLILLLISAFVVLIVLMQRTSQSGGMGAALGGGAAESAFGAETNSILMKGTIYGIVAFFLVSLGLYLMYQSAAADRVQEVDLNTMITAGESSEAAAEEAPAMLETAKEDGTEAAAAGSEMQEAVVEESLDSNPSEAADTLPANN